jgi:hypothetical protein
MTAVSNALAAISPLASSAGSTAASAAAAALDAAISAASAYAANTGTTYGNAQAVSGAALVSTLQVLKANVQRGEAPATLQAYGGSLVTIAAQYYGDPTLAQQLAAANGLSGLQLPPGQLTTIVLPPLQGSTIP